MGTLVFQATLGGQVNLNGPNTASTFNIAVPATTGTMVTTGDTGSVSSTMLANSLSLVTPALGTPASGVMTNVTGLPISTGVSGLGTGVATALAVNTGSAGAFVLYGGALGTPTSGTLTNATGLPLTTGVTGILGTANGGTGVANNAASTLTISGNFASTFVVSGAYSYTFPAATDTLVNLGSTQTLTSKTLTNPTVTNYVESVVAIGTVTSSSTLTLTSGTVQTATLTASTACTFTMPTATAGKSFVLLLKQAAATGNGTATFTGVKWGTAGAPTITATAGKMDILTFIADGTNWYGSAAQGYTP